MPPKSKSWAHYQIHGITANEYLIIYDHIIHGMNFLEKEFKKNNKIRLFCIEDMWTPKFENGTLTCDMTDKARKIPGFLSLDLHTVFSWAHKCWMNNSDFDSCIDKISFVTSVKHSHYRLNENNKRVWTGPEIQLRKKYFNFKDIDNIADIDNVPAFDEFDDIDD